MTTDYWWDDNNDLPQLAIEQQGSTAIREYHYTDRLLSMTTPGGTYYYHHDTLDSTSAVTNSAGATEWTYTYTPYGEPRQTTKVDPNAPDNPIQYTGQLIDPETGLYDLRARTYNPAIGGFLTTDPLDPRRQASPRSPSTSTARECPRICVGMTERSVMSTKTKDRSEFESKGAGGAVAPAGRGASP